MNKKIGNLFKGDKVVWMIFFFLCMISIVEVFSASSGLTYKSSNYVMPIIKHVGTIIAGLAIAIITLNIPCRFFKLSTFFFYLLSIVLLIVVLFMGENVNGASRQLEIAGLSIQPSEIAKGTVVLAVAQILSATQTEHGADKSAMKFILWVTLPIAGLIGLENLSTAALLCAVVFLMMIIGRVPMAQIGKLLGVCTLGVAILFTLIMVVGHDKNEDDPQLTKTEKTEKAQIKEEEEEKGTFAKIFHRADTWKSRVNKFMDDKEVAPSEYDLDKDAQVAHANIAIVSSDYIGKGPGNSVERDFLAQAFSDFIYAIIIEEMGIEGAAFVVALYIWLLFRTAKIASRCENNFPAFLAMGLALLLVVQATFNMLVAVGIVPVTGQPLPLISKGGSSTIINCAYIGAILSISRSAKTKSPKATKKKIVEEEPLAATT